MKTAPVLHRTYPSVRTLRDYLLTLQAGNLASLIEGVPSGHPKQLDELLDRALACNSEGALPALPQAIDFSQSRSQQEVGTS